MKKTVMLAITGRQEYPGQEPEVIELMTEGTMEYGNGGWDISYEESALTGLDRVSVRHLCRAQPETQRHPERLE